MSEDSTPVPFYDTAKDDPGECTSDAVSSVWARGDGPLPNDTKKLVDEIRGLAAARQRDARTHRPFCKCDGCRLRRKRQAPLLRQDDAA